MPSFRHLPIVITYSFTALLLAFVLFVFVPEMDGASVILIGVMVFLFGTVTHAVFIRHDWEKRLDTQVGRLLADLRRVGSDMDRIKADMHDMRAMFEPDADVTRRGGLACNPRVAAEVRMLQALVDKLSERTAAKDENVEPVSGDFAIPVEVDTEKLSEARVIEIVREAVRTDRIDVFCQPIVALPQRKLRLYEMFSRIKIASGQYLEAERYIDIAKREKLVTAIDNLLLLRCMQMIRDSRGEQERLIRFCNISVGTLQDRGFMNDLSEFLREHPELVSRIVFELSQSDFANLPSDVDSILDVLGRIGCRFSMDQVTSLKIDPDELNRHSIRYVKIDAPTLLEEIVTDEGRDALRKLRRD
ncbi:MAG: EAL domain-containing protein, partial [Pseudomonadota bacterium]|nr:EAL domain-containing protein [Pseudomonadota bacterium]